MVKTYNFKFLYYVMEKPTFYNTTRVFAYNSTAKSKNFNRPVLPVCV